MMEPVGALQWNRFSDTITFVFDLKSLPKYEMEDKDYAQDSIVIVNAFMNLGLINNEVDTGMWGNRTILELNDVGQTLHRILKQNNWYSLVSVL